jgi:hypothetical protein
MIHFIFAFLSHDSLLMVFPVSTSVVTLNADSTGPQTFYLNKGDEEDIIQSLYGPDKM